MSETMIGKQFANDLPQTNAHKPLVWIEQIAIERLINCTKMHNAETPNCYILHDLFHQIIQLLGAKC